MPEQAPASVEKALNETGGVLNLEPAWVTRDFLPAGHRLGLDDYSVEDKRRGEISERWIGSTTHADNPYGPEDEGLSYVSTEGGIRFTLKDGIEAAGDLLLGKDYYQSHGRLGILTKFYDFAAPIPFHLHQMDEDAAKLGLRPKTEAYCFVEGVPMGDFPYTFFGFHPSIAEPENREKIIPYLEEWETDDILKFSRAYKLMPGEGFYLPSGVPHAPGTALTLELQEDSDVFAFLQGIAAGKPVSKDLLWKDVETEVRERNDLKAFLDLINWDVSGDPYFYEHYHTEPIPVKAPQQEGSEEYWAFYGSNKFSGKKTVIQPGGRHETKERGAYPLLVWQGKGTFDGRELEAGGDHSRDEFFIAYDKATSPAIIENTGDDDLVLFKFFGPDINPDAPSLPSYP